MDKDVYESLSQVEYDPCEAEEPVQPSVVNKPSDSSFYFGGFRVRFTKDFSIGPEPRIGPEHQALAEFQSMFEELGCDLNQQEVAEWLSSDANDSGVQVYTDSEICDLVTNVNGDEDDTDDEEAQEGQKNECPVSNSEAARYFEQCLIWLEHQPEATPYNTTLLRELQSLASNKRIDSLKQAKVTNYFMPLQ